MNAHEKSPLPPRKKTKISFRTDEATLGKIKTKCKEKNITASLFIENSLAEIVLRENANLFLENEKRKKKRKKCSIQALVVKNSATARHPCFIQGTILDISESSLQIILKNFADNSFQEENFHILLDLHKDSCPMLIPCSTLREERIHGQCILIAQLGITASSDRQALHDFLKSGL